MLCLLTALRLSRITTVGVTYKNYCLLKAVSAKKRHGFTLLKWLVLITFWCSSGFQAFNSGIGDKVPSWTRCHSSGYETCKRSSAKGRTHHHRRLRPCSWFRRRRRLPAWPPREPSDYRLLRNSYAHGTRSPGRQAIFLFIRLVVFRSLPVYDATRGGMWTFVFVIKLRTDHLILEQLPWAPEKIGWSGTGPTFCPLAFHADVGTSTQALSLIHGVSTVFICSLFSNSYTSIHEAASEAPSFPDGSAWNHIAWLLRWDVSGSIFPSWWASIDLSIIQRLGCYSKNGSPS